MTDPHPNGTPIDEGSADRLSTAWNDIVADRSPDAGDTDDELIHLARRLHAATTTVRELPDFRQSLRETIMHAPSASIPITGLRPTQAGGPPASRPIASIPAALRRTGARWLGLAATIALLLTTAAGAYLGGVGTPADDGRGATMGAYQQATPGTKASTGAQIMDDCRRFQPYIPACGAFPNVVAHGLIAGAQLPGANLDVTRFQMMRWQIEADQRATFQTSIAPVTGVGMDIVINGAYAASFTAPVIVARNEGGGIRILFEYLDAGVEVELVRGDIVSYGLGTKVEIRNLLTTSVLQFKTILFFDGTVFPDTLAEDPATELEWVAVVDGEGTLPKPIADYPQQELSIVLTYSQILEGEAFPPEYAYGSVILGPVDPVNGPVGTEGFVLWAIEGQG